MKIGSVPNPAIDIDICRLAVMKVKIVSITMVYYIYVCFDRHRYHCILLKSVRDLDDKAHVNCGDTCDIQVILVAIY